MPKLRQVLVILIALTALLLLVLAAANEPQLESTLFPPPADARRLNDQFWAWLAKAECPRPTWSPDFTSNAAYLASVQPLRDQLLARTGELPNERGGKVIERRKLAETSSYTIEWLRLSSRLPDVSVSGYLVLPKSSAKSAPSVIFVPGVGVPPHSLLGWRLEGDELFVKYAGTTPVETAGKELIRAGFAVFVPWINDERGNYPGTHWEARDWARFPWFELSAWGAVQRHYGSGGDEHSLIVPGLMAAVDFFEQERGSPVALMGWDAGAHLAAVTAAVDERVDAAVLLSPVLDKRAQFADPVQLQHEAPFTMLGCSFGHLELAAMIAPRPLLFSSSYADPLYARQAAYSSEDVYRHIERLYRGLSSDSVARLTSEGQTTPEARATVEWLSKALGYEPPRHATAVEPMPTPPATWWYSGLAQHNLRREMMSHLDRGKGCERIQVSPDFSSVEQFTESMQSARRQLVADVVGQLPPQQPVTVLERKTVRGGPEYTLEWVRFKGRFANVDVGGYLATPQVRNEKLPAVLSFDGNYDQAWLYNLKPAPFVYLHGYGDALARSGHVVFSPYMPSTLADGWGAILGAKTGHEQTVWSYLVPLYMSGVDFLLSEPHVDDDRIAAYGISYAAYAALLTASIDERIAAVVYSNPFETPDPQFVANGPYVMPNIWKTELCSYTSQLHTGSLVAPRAFIWENGLRDANVPQRYEPMDADAVSSLYKRLSLPNRFRLARHDGGHETRPEETIPLLDQMLGFAE